MLSFIREGDSEREFRIFQFKIGYTSGKPFLYIVYGVGIKGEGIKKKRTIKLNPGEVLELLMLLRKYVDLYENYLESINERNNKEIKETQEKKYVDHKNALREKYEEELEL